MRQKNQKLKFVFVLICAVICVFCFSGSAANGSINFGYDMKSNVEIKIDSDLSLEQIKASVTAYADGYNLLSGDDDIVTIKNIESTVGGYIITAKLRRIDKVKGMGDFDFSSLSDFFAEGSESSRLVQSWANGSWRYSSSVWFGDNRGNVDITREHEGKTQVLPKDAGGKVLSYESFAEKIENEHPDSDVFLFRMVATQFTLGNITSITLGLPGEILYYAGNGITITDGKIVLTPTVIKGDLLKTEENGDITTVKNTDIKVMYGYVVFNRGMAPATVAAIISGCVVTIGALIALYIYLVKVGKKYKLKKTAEAHVNGVSCENLNNNGGEPNNKEKTFVAKKEKSNFSIGVYAVFHGKTWANIKKNRLMYLIALPAVIFVLIFNYAPMFGIVIAFQDYKILEGVGGSEWVGFKAFHDIFFLPNTSAYRLLRNTLYISVIRIATNFPIILLFALLIREIKSRAGKSLIQSVSYIPFFISWVAVSGIAYNLFSADEGLINKALKAVGLTPVSWYTEEGPWWWILAFSSLWKGMGWSTLIYMSAMGSINSELYDACLIDGGGRWQQAKVVTLPGLANVIAIQLLMDSASVLSDNADQILAMTNKSPSLGNTDVIGSSMIANITGGGSFAQATALGLVQGLVGLIMVFIVNSVVKKTENEGIL